MKCSGNLTTFTSQGSRVIIVVVQVAAVKIYVAAVEALGKKEREDETHSVYRQYWWKKLVWVPVISFCKISFTAS